MIRQESGATTQLQATDPFIPTTVAEFFFADDKGELPK